MINNNKLDTTFGPVGSSAGMFVFIAGIVLTWFYFSGVILVLIGAFVGFSYSSTLIDYEKKRVRFSNNLFGFIPTGKWIHIEPSMKIGMKESSQTYTSFSRGNRQLDIPVNDYRLVLFDCNNTEVMQLKKFASKEAALQELEIERIKLGFTKL